MARTPVRTGLLSGSGQVCFFLISFFQKQKNTVSCLSTRDDVHIAVPPYFRASCALHSFFVQSSAARASGLPHGRHAFRRKAPILKVPEGSCGMLSAGGAPSLTHYIFCTHVCSQPESVLVLHSSGVLSSCRFSWFSFMNDTSLYDW